MPRPTSSPADLKEGAFNATTPVRRFAVKKTSSRSNSARAGRSRVRDVGGREGVEADAAKAIQLALERERGHRTSAASTSAAGPGPAHRAGSEAQRPRENTLRPRARPRLHGGSSSRTGTRPLEAKRLAGADFHGRTQRTATENASWPRCLPRKTIRRNSARTHVQDLARGSPEGRAHRGNRNQSAHHEGVERSSPLSLKSARIT